MVKNLQVGDVFVRKSDGLFFTLIQVKENTYHFEPNYDLNNEHFPPEMTAVAATWCKKSRLEIQFDHFASANGEGADSKKETAQVEEKKPVNSAIYTAEYGSW